MADRASTLLGQPVKSLNIIPLVQRSDCITVQVIQSLTSYIGCPWSLLPLWLTAWDNRDG
jgi:hypothetical protein